MLLPFLQHFSHFWLHCSSLNSSNTLLCDILALTHIGVFRTVFFSNPPTGPGEASRCREAKIAARLSLPLNCRAITLIAGAILNEEKKPSLVGGRQFGDCESKLPRDSGKSIFAARHQDVSQGPLGCFSKLCIYWAVSLRKGKSLKCLENSGVLVFSSPIMAWPLWKAKVRDLENTISKTLFGTLSRQPNVWFGSDLSALKPQDFLRLRLHMSTLHALSNR